MRLVGVDGHAGSGKTTFAGQLARALGDAPVLHLDDIASHDALFAWGERLLTQVVEPLSRGEFLNQRNKVFCKVFWWESLSYFVERVNSLLKGTLSGWRVRKWIPSCRT